MRSLEESSNATGRMCRGLEGLEDEELQILQEPWRLRRRSRPKGRRESRSNAALFVLFPSDMLLVPALLLAGLVPALCSAATPKLDKFRQLAKKHNGLIPLDAAQYDELTSAPRDYSVSVVLTAMGAQYKCVPCQ